VQVGPSGDLQISVPLGAKLIQNAYTIHHPEGLGMPLILRQRNVGPITLLELSERLTIENVHELRDKLEDLVDQGCRFFLLDCSQITVIDSQGIGGLVRNWLSLKNQGGKLKLLDPSVRLREVMQIVRLDKVIECFDDIELALRGF
jgi:stage II sporulation protein AA (anti-sigma F factor antagonist)